MNARAQPQPQIESVVSFTLHFHPLSSFCQKVLVGLYELEIPFEKHLVVLQDPAQRRALEALWPIGKFPVLSDHGNDLHLAESSNILEYIDQLGSRRGPLIPQDPALARESRLRERCFDLYVNTPVGKIVTDKLRPESARDRLGVQQAEEQLVTAYGVADAWLHQGPWAIGGRFSVADCAAAPALLYAREIVPLEPRFPALAAYYDRLTQRPSFARVLEDVKPYWSMFLSARGP